jgi:hypothetical protein
VSQRANLDRQRKILSSSENEKKKDHLAAVSPKSDQCFNEMLAAAYFLPPFSLHFFKSFTLFPLLQMPALDGPSPGLAEAANGTATKITAMKQARNMLTSLVIFDPSGEASRNLGCQSIYPTSRDEHVNGVDD